MVYDGTGAVISPIDEFNAPVGAGLCEDTTAMFPAAAIAGDDGILPYGSCLQLDVAGDILGQIFDIDFDVDATHPVCETTRTTISALRIGDYVIGTMPGELTVLLANYLREQVAGRRGAHDPRRLLAGPRRLHAAPRGLDAWAATSRA